MKHALQTARSLGTRLILGCTLAVGLAATARADEETPGVKIGVTAPDFSLKDQNGKATALSALLKQGNVALVFYRSADW